MGYETVLVIGGSGFIGSHVVKKLVDAGKYVTVPTRRRERAKHLLPLPTVDVVEGDISTVFLEHLIAEHDAVINLVGIL
ncbi:NAD-dependent epimerase/dehydratase family protein, partial [Acinetobacter baumannii]